MTTRDLLEIAAEAAERLEREGLVACGRRVDGVTRVDFWTRAGDAYSLVLENDAITVDEIVAACLAEVGVPASPRPRVVH